MLAAFWLLNIPSLFSKIPLASVTWVNPGWKQQAWLPHLIQIYSWIGKRTQQNKKFCLQTFKKWVKGSLRKRKEAQTPTMMTVAREKKEAWRQVSVFCLGILTNGWINIKCKSLSLCMDCSPELSPHVYAYFASWMPWTLSIESHTLNSIHLQWDLLYVAWHSFRRRVLQVMLPTLCPSTPFPLWLQLSSVLRHIGFLSESKMLLWTHNMMGMLKNTS